MLESFDTGKFDYQKLTLEEQEKRGILGRLTGIIADTVNPTRNGRKYSAKLWEKVFNDPIMQERIKNRCCFGELGHPADREETDMEKIAVCLAEQPKKGRDGKLYGVFDILGTPNGRILKTLCDYGCNIGISSRGSGDLVTDFDGQESVDPDTYDCQGFDVVLIPAVKEARLAYVTEALNTSKYNKTLRAKLQESLDKASEDDKKVMEESLNSIGISLNEGSWSIPDNKEALENLRKILENPVSPDSAIDSLYDIFGDDNLYDNLHDDKENGVTDCRDTIISALKRLLDNESLDEESSSILKSIIDEYTEKNPLNENFKNDPLRQSIYDIAEYFKESEYPIEPNKWFGYDNWDDVLMEINLNPGQAFEMAEGFKEELEDYIRTTDHLAKSAKKRGSDFDYYDDPEYEIFQDFLKDLNKYMEKYLKDNNYNDKKDESLEEDIKIPSEFLKRDAIDYLNNPLISARWSSAYTKEVEDYINEVGKDNIKNEVQNTAVDNNEAMVEELQNSLKQINDMKDQILDLQEKLSVSYAKECSLNEELESKKSAISNLTKASMKAEALKNRIVKLEEQTNSLKEELSKSNKTRELLSEKLTKSKATNSSLLENINNISNSKNEYAEQLEKLQEDNKSLNESLESLKTDYELKKSKYTSSLENSNKLVEHYKNIASRAVNKYIESKALSLGVKPEEIKNKLPESYSFKDIDSICEELKQYKININRLPFNTMLREDIKMKATPSKNDKLAIAPSVDDEVDDQLLGLAKMN